MILLSLEDTKPTYTHLSNSATRYVIVAMAALKVSRGPSALLF
jgi:hypothetical protein